MANPSARELRPILDGLNKWRPIILRSTFADAVTFEIVDDGIAANVSWSRREPGSWQRVFTTQELLGTLRVGSTWIGARRACGFARLVIQSVQEKRGI